MEREEIEMEINKNVTRLISILQTGLTFKSPFLKGGIEFSSLRPYIPGVDSAKDIDWKASVKGRGIFVREFIALQKLNLFLAIDSSASMFYGTTKIMKHEYAAIITGTLIKACISSQVNVGVGFSHQIKGLVDIISPSVNPGIYRRVLSLILDRKYEGKFDFKNFLRSLISMVTSNSVVIILSDFLDLGENWEKELLTASQKFNSVLCLSIRDPTEETLPAISRTFRFQHPETGEIVEVDLKKARKKYAEFMENYEKNLKEKIEKCGVKYRKVLTTQPFIHPLIEFLR
jgi:uncharacterized protein (DUF58 family)